MKPGTEVAFELVRNGVQMEKMVQLGTQPERRRPPQNEDWAMILVVDDDISVTTSLSLLLKQAGYQTATAASPAEALEWLERGGCELVLQDMNFSRQTSGEEGMELLQEIKQRVGQCTGHFDDGLGVH